MALIVCPECGAQISDASTTCVHCGYPLVDSTGYEVVVTDYSGTYKSKAISAISDVCGYSLSDARTIINDLPQTIITNVDESTAIKIAQGLDAEGIDVSIYEGNNLVSFTSTRSNGSGFFKTLGTLLLINSLNRRYYRPRFYYSRRRTSTFRPLGFSPRPVVRKQPLFGRTMGPSPRGGFGGSNPRPNNRSVRNGAPKVGGIFGGPRTSQPSRGNGPKLGSKGPGPKGGRH